MCKISLERPAYTMNKVLRGFPPWLPADTDGALAHVDGSAALAALKMKLHRYCAELARFEEALQFIPGEAADSLNLYRYQIALLLAATEGHLSHSSSLAVGKVFRLRAVLRRMLALERSAVAIHATKHMTFQS